MSYDDHERAASITEDVQSSSHECRAYTLPLAIREHGQWRQTHPDDPSAGAVDHDRRKKDVTHDGVIHCHQRQRIGARALQILDEVGFRRLSERPLVDASNLGGVFGLLGADGNHVSSYAIPSRRSLSAAICS